jgi:hypothetical protein
MIVEVDIPWSLPVCSNEVLVSWRPFRLRVARQHALYAHADRLDMLYRTPTLCPEKVKAYKSVRVDVGVERDWAVIRWRECNFRRFCTKSRQRIQDYVNVISRTYWVCMRKLELETEYLALVDWVVVQNPNIQKPFLEAVCRHELYPRRQAFVHLYQYD